MKKIVFTGLLVMLPSICSAQATSLSDLGVSDEGRCYHTKMGIASYQGIPNKRCICDGSLVRVFSYTDEEANSLVGLDCPEGIMCDSFDVYCKGKIKGCKFYYRDGNKEGEFETVQEWEDFCNTRAKDQRDCFNYLDQTKAAIDNDKNNKLISTEE